MSTSPFQPSNVARGRLMNSSDRFAQRHTDCESTHDTANVGDVLAAVAVSQNPHDPLEGLELRDVPKPQPRPGGPWCG